MAIIFQLIGLCFGIPVLLALALSGAWRSPKAWLLSCAACAALSATLLAVGIIPHLLPEMSMLEDLHWNWIGKLASIAATMIVYSLLPVSMRVEAGLFSRPRPAKWFPVLIVSLILIAAFWAIAWFQRDPGASHGLSLETLLFQATLPGLDEEASFRGVILALLIGAFGKPLRIAGIAVGWGALPIIAFFGLAHGYSSLAGGVAIDWQIVAITGATGVSLLWLKEKTHSIWVPVIVHNLLNVGSTSFG